MRQRVEERLDLSLRFARLDRDRMEIDEKPGLVGSKAERPRQIRARMLGRRRQLVETGRAHGVNPPGLFAHLADTGGVNIGGNEMNVTHLGQGVSDKFIDGAFGHRPAVDMNDRQIEPESGIGAAKHFVAVAEQHQEIGSILGEILGQGQGAEANRLADRSRGIGSQGHFQARRDDKIICFDFPPRFAKFFGPMRAARQQTEMDTGIAGERT